MIEPLILPKSIQVHEEAANCVRFIIEPLYPGYGTTLGNALRRILLSSLQGCSVSALSIDGVPHEFSALKDVKEDVVDIMLNVKQVRFSMMGEHEEPVKVEIDFTGTGVVKAKEFKVPAGVKCVTPDVPIATVTSPKGSFHLTAYLTRGRGFLAVESREKERLEIGTIAVDAIYSPVRHVVFTLDHMRVGQMTNYDKVLLTVETDGSITPLEAMKEAISILREQVAGLVIGDELSVSEGTAADEAGVASADGMDEGKSADEVTSEVTGGDTGEETVPPKKRGRKNKPD